MYFVRCLLVSLLVSSAVAAAPASAPPTPVTETTIDRIVAVVNRSVVLQSEVDTLLEAMLRAEPLPAGKNQDAEIAARREKLLDTLIAEKLLEEEVRKLHVDVTEAEVDRVVKGMMAEHSLNEEQLKMALSQQGMSLDEYREGLKKQLTKMKIIQLKVKSRVQVNDQDVKGVYQQQKSLDEGEYQVRARHILTLAGAPDAEARILAAKKDLDAGQAFDDVAKRVSEDGASRERGGDLGVFGRGEMVPEFEKAAFAAAVGTVVGPIKTQFGYHLIRVDERVAVARPTEDKALENIRERLYQGEVEAQFNMYVEELKRQAHIERRL